MRFGHTRIYSPFMFVYAPQLLLQGTNTLEGVLVLITAVIGIFILAVAGAGHFYKAPLSPLLRVIAFISAGLLIIPGIWTDLLGLAGASLVTFLSYFRLGPGQTVPRESGV